MSNKIYLASSWSNPHHTRVLKLLREAGHDVYDYREKGFLFSKLVGVTPDTNIDILPTDRKLELLDHETSQKAFMMDYKALQECDVLVMLQVSGNDAHLELGFAAGQGKYTIVYLADTWRVGLMDKVANSFVTSDQQLLEELR